MSIKVAELIKEMESVSPGLAKFESIEQSSCFVFHKGKVITFNDEIACTRPTLLPVEGAIKADRFLMLLHRWKDKTCRAVAQENKLILKGKGKQATILVDSNIELPIDTIKTPKEWHKLPKSFADGIKRVEKCVCKEKDQFAIMCIHINPKFVESTNNLEVARYSMKMKIKKDFLVRAGSVKHVVELGMTHFGETKYWVHFKNSEGLQLCCRRFLETFPVMDKVLEVNGTKVVMPKGLTNAALQADTYASEEEEAQATVRLEAGQLVISSRGISGSYQEKQKVKYKGKPIAFTIDPSLLAELSNEYHEYTIGDRRMKIEQDRFQYVSVLGVVDEASQE